MSELLRPATSVQLTKQGMEGRWGCSHKHHCHQQHLLNPTITATCSLHTAPVRGRYSWTCSIQRPHSYSYQRIQQKRLISMQEKETNSKMRIWLWPENKETFCPEGSDMPTSTSLFLTLNMKWAPDMQSRPIWKPKLMQDSINIESAETELETCYLRKPPDESTGLADSDPHWGRRRAGQQLEERLSHATLAPVFVNTRTYVCACTLIHTMQKQWCECRFKPGLHEHTAFCLCVQTHSVQTGRYTLWCFIKTHTHTHTNEASLNPDSHHKKMSLFNPAAGEDPHSTTSSLSSSTRWRPLVLSTAACVSRSCKNSWWG